MRETTTPRSTRLSASQRLSTPQAQHTSSRAPLSIVFFCRKCGVAYGCVGAAFKTCRAALQHIESLERIWACSRVQACGQGDTRLLGVLKLGTDKLNASSAFEAQLGLLIRVASLRTGAERSSSNLDADRAWALAGSDGEGVGPISDAKLVADDAVLASEYAQTSNFAPAVRDAAFALDRDGI
ncbi:unnamed protein product [Peniophora sp. CBMAI 1063]|nr:unnamed protein product [Peniophora sp. CBMAI 1063]